MTTSPPTTPQFPQIDLIPWDPDSPSHVSRLFNQRVACTWNSEFVESWRERQRQGTITLQWIVLPMVPTRDHLHTLHISQFPLESEPLIDSATTFNGIPRTPPSPPTSFLPIGHIALEVQSSCPCPCPSPPSPSPTTYKISGLYISRALRSLGLGRTSMNTIEEFASRPPLGAKKLTLEVIANEYPGKQERNRALKVVPLPIKTLDWYLRRGYVVTGSRDGVWPERDEEGRVWTVRCMFMEKVVG